MRKFFNDFKNFAVKGNVLDLAVAVIIGGAFGKIVSSLVADVVMPPLGLLMGGIDLSGRRWVLQEATEQREEVVMNIGLFLQNVLDFLVIALVIFLMIKAIGALKERVRREEKTAAPEAKPLTKDQELLAEIRDLLKEKRPE